MSTKITRVKYDELTEVQQPTPLAVDLGEIDSATLTNPPAGTKSLFLDSLDSTVKTKDEFGVIESLGSGSGGGLQPLFIDHTNIPSELVRNRIYEADFSGASTTLGKSLVLTGMTDTNFNQTYSVASVNGSIDASDNFVADTSNKVFYYEAVASTTWYVVVLDELGAWAAYSCDTDPNTWTDALALTLTLEETIVSTSETQDGYSVPDSIDSKVDFTGNPANVLTVVFPEGTGSETFIIGFRITGLADGITVSFETTNSQNIFLPDATTTTTITGINAKTYFEFAWDQSRYVYGDVDSPTFANLAASLGDVVVDTLTVGTSIIGGEATATQAGTVSSEAAILSVNVGIDGVLGTGTTLTDADTITMNFYRVGSLVKVYGSYLSAANGDAWIFPTIADFPWAPVEISASGYVTRSSALNPSSSSGFIGYMSSGGFTGMAIGHRSNSSNNAVFCFSFTYMTT